MKKVIRDKKVVTVEKETLFECEICHKQYNYRNNAEQCEEQHACKEHTFAYDIDSYGDSIGTFIRKYCTSCGLSFVKELCEVSEADYNK
jgi:hypothetical protein